MCAFVFFFKQKTAYEMRISDWSSDVCSSDLADRQTSGRGRLGRAWGDGQGNFMGSTVVRLTAGDPAPATLALVVGVALARVVAAVAPRSEAHTSELQSLMRISYAVFCLKQKKRKRK